MSTIRPINRHVSLLFRMGERFLNRELAGSGISSGTAPLLLELRDGEVRNPVALAAAIGVDKAYVTRALQSLERAGYVAVVPTMADGRSVTVSLTGEGWAAAGRVEDAMRAWVAVVSRGVSQADMDTVNAVFNRFYANAQEYLTSKPKLK
jgi:DNA-binding MarR family transcriptional regulator